MIYFWCKEDFWKLLKFFTAEQMGKIFNDWWKNFTAKRFREIFTGEKLSAEGLTELGTH